MYCTVSSTLKNSTSKCNFVQNMETFNEYLLQIIKIKKYNNIIKNI